MKKPNPSLSLFEALSDVRADFILESSLPDAPPAPRSRRAERVLSAPLGGRSLGGWGVAAACLLVSIGLVVALALLGRGGRGGPAVGTEPPGTTAPETDSETSGETVAETRLETTAETRPEIEPPAEPAPTPTLAYESHGDGTCTVKAGAGFGRSEADRELVIPIRSPAGELVTHVAAQGFAFCEEMSSVTLPDTLRVLGDRAFRGCPDLKWVYLGSDLRSIGARAFESCTALEAINPFQAEGLESMGESAFAGCRSLISVFLPDSLTVLPGHAFDDCMSLQHLTLPKGLTRIEDYALHGCTSLEALDIPDGVTIMGDYALYACLALRRLELPEGLSELGDYALSCCYELTELSLPASLSVVGRDVLEETWIEVIHYGGSTAAWGSLPLTVPLMPGGCRVICSDGEVHIPGPSA